MSGERDELAIIRQQMRDGFEAMTSIAEELKREKVDETSVAKHSVTLGRVLWTLLGFLVVGGSAGGWALVDRVSEVKAEVEQAPKEIVEQAESIGSKNAERIDDLDAGLENLAREFISQKDETAEMMLYISELVEADDRRKKADVEAPPAIKRAKAKLAAQKNAERVEDLLNGSRHDNRDP